MFAIPLSPDLTGAWSHELWQQRDVTFGWLRCGLLHATTAAATTVDTATRATLSLASLRPLRGRGDHLRWRRGLLLRRWVLLGLGHHDWWRHVDMGHIRYIRQLRGWRRHVLSDGHNPVAAVVGNTVAGAECLRRHPDEHHHAALVPIQRRTRR